MNHITIAARATPKDGAPSAGVERPLRLRQQLYKRTIPHRQLLGLFCLKFLAEDKAFLYTELSKINERAK